METMAFVRQAFPNRPVHRIRAACTSVLMALTASGTVLGQTPQIPVSGTVTATGGFPLRGVTIRVQGTDIIAFTNASGRYSITAAPSDGVLNFTLIGQKPARAEIGGRTTIDITMERLAFLEEVVVTAYSESQRRGEITGAVASVNLESVGRQTTASFGVFCRPSGARGNW